ncbi:alcohol dehydrogenase catalytic domain-containing protein [bacterium]|nr:alcohol dehydrogenase catalytic domain-containing protein [bacterium]
MQKVKDKTMWALTYDRKDDWSTSKGLKKTRMPVPVIDDQNNPEDIDQVLIKVKYAGFCGSDRGIWFRKAFGPAIISSLERENRDTRIIGHELLGEVISAGSRAKSHYGFKPGQTVSTESHIICNRCFQCQQGQSNVCADDIIIGISRDGCFAEYIKLPAQVLWPTDITVIDPLVAAIQEPFGNAVHCCTKCDLRGKTVAVFGCGTIGLFVIMIARALGASKIIGIEPMELHAEMAKELGADEVIRLNMKKTNDPSWKSDLEVISSIKDFTRGIGADVSLEMSGFNSSLNNAIHSTRRGGDVVLFGLKSGEAILENFDELIVNGISLHSVIGREIMKTWYITRNQLESKANGIHDNILNVILANGTGTIADIADFNPVTFERMISEHPKIVIRFAG